jgi:hypothetical protein
MLFSAGVLPDWRIVSQEKRSPHRLFLRAASCIYATEGRLYRLQRKHMSAESPQELFLDELKDLYSAGKQITRVLPQVK